MSAETDKYEEVFNDWLKVTNRRVESANFKVKCQKWNEQSNQKKSTCHVLKTQQVESLCIMEYCLTLFWSKIAKIQFLIQRIVCAEFQFYL